VRRSSVLLVPLLLLAAGCGASRTPVADLSAPALPHGTRVRAYASAGLRLRTPSNWRAAPAPAPMVATLSSGEALVTIWRYPRTEPLPATAAALRAALAQLMAIVRSRDRHITFTSTRVARIAGAPALVLTGSETLSGVRRSVRSVHVYAHGAEVVFDAIAPPSSFPVVDRLVFRPVAASLRLSAPRA
jgi:hypothetical protein